MRGSHGCSETVWSPWFPFHHASPGFSFRARRRVWAHSRRLPGRRAQKDAFPLRKCINSPNSSSLSSFWPSIKLESQFSLSNNCFMLLSLIGNSPLASFRSFKRGTWLFSVMLFTHYPLRHGCLEQRVKILTTGLCFLSESRTIMRYISHEYGKRGEEQVYEIPKLQGIAAAWIDVEDHQFDPPASKLIWELVFKPQKGLPTDEGVVEEEEAKLVKVLDVYEERLSNSVFLGGDKFTSADLTHIPSLYLLMKTPVKRLFEERPRVRAWYRGVMSRPGWEKMVEMVEKVRA